MKQENKKSKASIYLWKLIVIIAAIFAIVLSIECFFLIEKTVKEIIGGSLEEYNTSMVAEPEETPVESDKTDIENKDESSIESFDSAQTETDNKSSENDNPVINDNTNTITDVSTNTIVEEENTNTIQTNAETNTVTDNMDTNTVENVIGNTVYTNTVNLNTINLDKISDEKAEKFVLEEKLVCKKIHEHLKICYLEQYTEEDRESVFLVIQMIDELPEMQYISERLQALEESGSDEEYAEYYSSITAHVKHIYSYYVALKTNEKDLRSYVTNSDKLLNLYNVCGINTISTLTEVNVQYYAYIDKVERGAEIPNKGDTGYTNDNRLEEHILPIIDTSAEKNGIATLPKNARGRGNTPVNALIQSIVTGEDGTIRYKEELTEIYSSAKFTIEGKTFTDKLNRFDGREENYYDLIEIWVLKSGKDPNSTEKNDWQIFSTVDVANGMYFTDDYTDIDGTAVHISNGATIRYVCEADDGIYDNACMFFDYDITNGGIYLDLNAAKNGTDTGKDSTAKQDQYDKNGTIYYIYANKSGINHPNNYNNYTQDNVSSDGKTAKLAFGNNSSGTELGDEEWKDVFGINNMLNMANLAGKTKNNLSSYSIATYGLTQGLDDDGRIIYSPGVNAPLLFNNEDAYGKTIYNDRFSLKFARNGDTYVLDAVTEENEDGNEIKEILKDLKKLNHPKPEHYHIYTNNFWPMDYVESYGTEGHDLKFGSEVYEQYRKRSHDANSFSKSDDGLDHNAFFGMQLSLDFYMVEDYVGPLEYYFFGDDDLWVFLDGKLVCDLGGVHTAVGEYTNLWDYVEKR